MRPAGKRRGKRLHVNEVAPVRSSLLVCFIGDFVARVIVRFLFRVDVSRGPVACEPDKRRPLREMLDGDRPANVPTG